MSHFLNPMGKSRMHYLQLCLEILVIPDPPDPRGKYGPEWGDHVAECKQPFKAKRVGVDVCSKKECRKAATQRRRKGTNKLVPGDCTFDSLTPGHCRWYTAAPQPRWGNHASWS